MEEVDLILMCSSCEKEKKASEFSKKNGCARGYSYKCKDCHNSYVRERWYPKNATKHRAASAKWTANNKARVKATALGLREEDVAIVLDASDGTCAVCQSDENLVLDHCHNTNVPRGVICRKCNLLLGHLGDSAESVKRISDRLIEYLSEAPRFEAFEGKVSIAG